MKLSKVWFWMFLSVLLLRAQAGLSAESADYSQAVSLFNAQNYQAALPLFQQVVQDDPKNSKAFYYLGSCQGKAGYLRGEVLNYYISDRLSPYPVMKAFADKLMDKLSLEDQGWVDQHLNDFFQPPALQPPAAEPSSAQPPPSLSDARQDKPTQVRFGFRVSTGMSFFNLADFQSDLAYRVNEVQGFQASSPSYGYNLQTSLDTMAPALEFNPYLAIGPDVEFGTAFSLWAGTSYSYEITDHVDPQYFVHSEYDLSSFEALLKARWYFLKTDSRKVRFFMEPAAGIQPISIHQAYTYNHTAGTPSTDQAGLDVNATAFDGGLNLGTVFEVAPGALLSLSAGYQSSSASGFQGTWTDSGNAAKNGAHGTLEIYTSPTTGRSTVLFIPDDPNKLSAFGENQYTLVYSRPIAVDQGGVRAAADFSYNF